ncbi:hypothetical protein AB0D08_05450 [Kitasatospora sp. NPDC048540]|uniref:hypothetical protein n=1 Tax=unclassified Kitasatospora TaxID=2633591 RepID=UPI00053A2111|nr:hypothetical protein [Kitasatospora sp. MBT63]
MTTPARPTAHATVPGVQDALGWPDGWQPRGRTAWIVTRDGDSIAAHRIRPEADQVFDDGIASSPHRSPSTATPARTPTARWCS